MMDPYVVNKRLNKLENKIDEFIPYVAQMRTSINKKLDTYAAYDT